jgi:hypothetical protein
MSTQRYISTSFWDDEWIQELDPSEKLLYLYFMTNPLTNISGVYKISVRRICFDTGFNQDTVGHLMTKFQKAGKAYRIGEYIVLPSWPKHQKWEKAPRIKDGIIACLCSLNEEMLHTLVKIGYKFDLKQVFDTLCIPYTYPSNYSDSDSDSDNDRDTESDPPDKPAKSPKHKHGEYKHVLLTSDEYLRLCEEWGEPELLRMIKELDEGIEAKGYKYKNHNLAIREWKKNSRGTPIPKPGAQEEKKILHCAKCGAQLNNYICPSCFTNHDTEGNAI